MRLLFIGAALVAALGCESAPPLERSCAGEGVELCAPHEWAEIASASLEPSELPVADFSVEAEVQLALERCPDAPAPHDVRLEAIIPDEAPADGGTDPVRVIELHVFEGVTGDLDTAITNPFIATIPPETDITLRFTARSGSIAGCESGEIEIPYRTGPMRR